MNDILKKRNPWAVAGITLFFSPVIGMLYIGKGKVALLYVAFFVFLIWGIFFSSFDIKTVSNIVFLSGILGIIHYLLFIKPKETHYYNKWYSKWYSLSCFIVMPLIILLPLRYFVYETFYIPGNSMAPNITKGDKVITTKMSYDSNLPSRGDVVTFHILNNKNIKYVKRIVGLPGETIKIQNGKVYINNNEALYKHKEGDIYYETFPDGVSYQIIDALSNSNLDNTSEYKIPNGHYFMLGDNRDKSYDSRVSKIGFIPLDNIIGKTKNLRRN